MIRKIVGVIGAILTFIFFLYLFGFIYLTFVPNYKFNFIISLILLLIFSFLSTLVYKLIANSEKAIENSHNTDKFEYVNINVKKPEYHSKKRK